MISLINQITEKCEIMIKGEKYTVITKTWYSIEEDENASYIKCELSNNKVLVIIPDDNYIYIGEVIQNMEYERLSQEEIKYNGAIFAKTGDGHQYIKSIEFGENVEGKCTFEDYESDDNIISLGYLTEENVRADVYAVILDMKDVRIIK